MHIDEFIKQHKHTNYCEAIILPNGDIDYATPSHIYKLISLTGKSKDEIDSIMPRTASPLEWLVSYTNCVAVWYDFFRFNSLTEKQKCSLHKLVKSGILIRGIKGVSTDEYYRCKYLEDYTRGLIDVIPSKKQEVYIVN